MDDFITTRLNCYIQGKTFLQRFVVSPAPLPGVDAILGLKFFQKHLGNVHVSRFLTVVTDLSPD